MKTQIQTMKKPLSYKEVSERYGININTLYWWVDTKYIPHRRLGVRTVQFDQDQIEQWLRSHDVSTMNKHSKNKKG